MCRSAPFKGGGNHAACSGRVGHAQVSDHLVQRNTEFIGAHVGCWSNRSLIAINVIIAQPTCQVDAVIDGRIRAFDQVQIASRAVNEQG